MGCGAIWFNSSSPFAWPDRLRGREAELVRDADDTGNTVWHFTWANASRCTVPVALNHWLSGTGRRATAHQATFSSFAALKESRVNEKKRERGMPGCRVLPVPAGTGRESFASSPSPPQAHLTL